MLVRRAGSQDTRAYSTIAGGIPDGLGLQFAGSSRFSDDENLRQGLRELKMSADLEQALLF